MKSYNLKFIIFIAVLFISSAVYAQNYTFKVMASSGTTKKASSVLKIGSLLNANEQITVDAKSYISLAHAKGGTVQISKAGTYSVKDLEAKLLASKKSVTQKYANFIIGEMTKGNGEDIHNNPYKYQNVTGSVERRLGGGIIMYLPKTSNTYQSQYEVAWTKPKTGKTYLYVLNEFNEIVKTFEKSGEDTTLTLDFKEFPESNLFTIIPAEKPISKAKLEKDGTKDGYGLKRLESANLEKFNAGWKDLKKVYSDDSDVNTKLNEAIFFEENEMYLDALRAYKEAMKLEPQNEAYQIAYQQFLIRRGITGKAPEESSSNEK